MKRLCFGAAVLLVILGCSQSSRTNQSYPYSFIQTKNEGQDRMDLYWYSGQIDPNQLQQFCSTLKAGFRSGTFYFAVIFDNKENARFPSNPLTAGYGIEEAPMKHIRAHYTYNRQNGYSRLDLYETNMWESSPTTIEVR